MKPKQFDKQIAWNLKTARAFPLAWVITVDDLLTRLKYTDGATEEEVALIDRASRLIDKYDALVRERLQGKRP